MSSSCGTPLSFPSQQVAKKVRRKYPQFASTYEKWQNETLRDSTIRGETETYRSSNVYQSESDTHLNHQQHNLFGCLVFLGEGVQSGVTDFRPIRKVANALAEVVNKECNDKTHKRIVVAGKLCFHSECPFTIVELLWLDGLVGESKESPFASEVSWCPLRACYSGVNSYANVHGKNETPSVPETVKQHCEWVAAASSNGTTPVANSSPSPATDDFFAVRLLRVEDDDEDTTHQGLASTAQLLSFESVVTLIANCDGVPVIPIKRRIEGDCVPADENQPNLILPTPIAEVPGLFAVPDFITVDEEQIILQQLEDYDGPSKDPSNDVLTTTPWEKLARRDVLHFSRRFFYDSMKVGQVGEQVSGPNPPFYDALIDRLCTGIVSQTIGFKRQREVDDMEFDVSKTHPNPNWPVPLDHRCDQLTVNRYRYDQAAKQSSGIAQHVDVHSFFGDIVFSISLASHTLLEYERPRTDNKDVITKRVPIFAAPRSLIIMTGESRFLWTHAIQHKYADVISEETPALVRGTRVSLTLRKARNNVAVEHNLSNCPYPIMCDSKI